MTANLQAAPPASQGNDERQTTQDAQLPQAPRVPRVPGVPQPRCHIKMTRTADTTLREKSAPAGLLAGALSHALSRCLSRPGARPLGRSRPLGPGHHCRPGTPTDRRIIAAQHTSKLQRDGFARGLHWCHCQQSDRWTHGLPSTDAKPQHLAWSDTATHCWRAVATVSG